MSAQSLAATAKRLIEKHGRSGCRVIRPNAGSPVTGTPWKRTTGADATIASGLKVLFVSAEEFRGDTKRDLTPGTKQVAMVASDSLPSGVRPKPGDHVSDGTDRFNILGIESVKPGDTEIVLTLHLEN